MSKLMKPVGTRVLVDIVEDKPVTSLILPEGIKKTGEQRAIVIGVGTDASLVVKVGDEILFNHQAALVIKVKDKEFILMEEKAIIAILNFDREGR